MTNAQMTETWRATLEDLERALETPFIPGELPRWVDTVAEAWAAARAEAADRLQDDHPEQFQTMVDEDPGMDHRVRALQAEDELLADCLADFERLLEKSAPIVRKAEPDEARVVDLAQKVVDDGLALVIRLRKQETAITTWRMETAERERGVGD